MNPTKIFIGISALLLSISCSSNQFGITSIYEDFNNEAEFGVQYFNIDGYENLSDSILIMKITDFAQKKLITKNLTAKVEEQYFYKKAHFSSCQDDANLRYEASEGEMGMLRGCMDLRVSYIWYTKEDTIQKTYSRYIVVFTKKNGEPRIASERTDTLKIQDNKWIVIKEGKIERKEVNW